MTIEGAAVVLATVVWTGDGPKEDPAVLTLEEQTEECEYLALRFHNTPVHAQDHPFTMDAGDPWGEIHFNLEFNPTGDDGRYIDDERVTLQRGAIWVLVSTDGEPLARMDVGENEERLVCMQPALF